MKNQNQNSEVKNTETINSVEEFLNTTNKRVYQKIGDDEEGNYYIFNSDLFVKMNLCETYDRFGQIIGCENAGCCSKDNQNQFRTSLDEEDFENEEEFEKAKQAEFEDEYGEEEHQTIEAYNFWNGNNWQTLFIANSGDDEDGGLEQLDDKLQAKILFEYESKEFESEGFGKEEYTSDNYKFVETQFASDPFIATVTEL